MLYSIVLCNVTIGKDDTTTITVLDAYNIIAIYKMIINRNVEYVLLQCHEHNLQYELDRIKKHNSILKLIYMNRFSSRESIAEVNLPEFKKFNRIRNRIFKKQ